MLCLLRSVVVLAVASTVDTKDGSTPALTVDAKNETTPKAKPAKEAPVKSNSGAETAKIHTSQTARAADQHANPSADLAALQLLLVQVAATVG